MTDQEQQLLKGLAERVNRTQVQDKDADAEQFIRQNIGSNPDALYILAQTTLVQEYALNQAQRQIADLKQQLQAARQAQGQPEKHGSFLGNLLGHRDEPQRQAPPPPPPPQYAQAQRSPVGPPPTDQVSGVGPGLAYPTGGYPIPGATVGYGAAPQGSGFLRGALQTATGVAAGALAFEGVESLLHGFGGHTGFGGFGGTDVVERPEIINNYYGDAAGGHDRSGMTDAGRDFADSMGPQHTPLESDHNTGLNEGSYLGGGEADRNELAATGDRDPDAQGVGDDDVDYSAPPDDSMTSDDVGQDFASDDTDDLGTDDGGGFDDGGGDFGSGDDGGGF
jgi:hypothetical protein